jgi:hypothetical protein
VPEMREPKISSFIVELQVTVKEDKVFFALLQKAVPVIMWTAWQCLRVWSDVELILILI